MRVCFEQHDVIVQHAVIDRERNRTPLGHKQEPPYAAGRQELAALAAFRVSRTGRRAAWRWPEAD
jgi:hypothetical protein